MSQHKFLEIKLEAIVPDEAQPRRSINEEGLENLKGSIAQVGLIYPLVVRETEDGQYKIIDGERRYRALKALGTDEVSCLVMEVKDSVEASFQQLIANIARDDLPTLDYCAFIHRLVNEYGQAQKEVAEKINRSESNISNAMKIGRHLAEGDFPEKLKKMIEDGSITGLSKIYKSIQVYEEKGEDGFNEGVEQIIASQKEEKSEAGDETAEPPEESDAAAEADAPADATESTEDSAGSKSISREKIEELRGKNATKPKNLETQKVPKVAVGDYLSYQGAIVKIIDVDDENAGETITFFCQKDAPVV